MVKPAGVLGSSCHFSGFMFSSCWRLDSAVKVLHVPNWPSLCSFLMSCHSSSLSQATVCLSPPGPGTSWGSYREGDFWPGHPESCK